MVDRTNYAELRIHWRPRWLSSIQEFADTETQRTKWLDPKNTNPHWSFVEYMCCYFDDCGLTKDDGGYELAIRQGLVTAAEAEAVAEFHALADTYNSPNGDDYDNRAVLDDPKWHRVVEAAKRAQARLSELITDLHERESLLLP